MPHKRLRLRRLLTRFRTGDLHAIEANGPEGPASPAESVERDPLANSRRFGGHRMAASVTFAVLFLVLVLRPTGLMGEAPTPEAAAPRRA